MLVYLAGSIEFSSDGGRGWRRELKAFLESQLGHTVYDPAEDEKKNLTDEEAANFRSWKNTDFDRYRAVVRKIIEFDLDLIEHRVDCLVCYWEKDTSKGGGTAAELTIAYRTRVPVLLVTELPIHEISGWVMSCADHIFVNFKELKRFLMASKARALKSGA